MRYNNNENKKKRNERIQKSGMFSHVKWLNCAIQLTCTHFKHSSQRFSFFSRFFHVLNAFIDKCFACPSLRYNEEIQIIISMWKHNKINNNIAENGFHLNANV